jgi:hypothetical protein
LVPPDGGGPEAIFVPPDGGGPEATLVPPDGGGPEATLVPPDGGGPEVTRTLPSVLEAIGPWEMVHAYALTLASAKTNAVRIVARFTLHLPSST